MDTISLEGEPLSTRDHWAARREALKGVSVFGSFDALEASRLTNGTTLGLVSPARLLGLDITPADSPVWTEEEIAKLLQEQMQGSLFDSADDEMHDLKTLKKLPFDFRYRYECPTPEGPKVFRHKLVDWEAGALYWNVRRRPDWQDAMR